MGKTVNVVCFWTQFKKKEKNLCFFSREPYKIFLEKEVNNIQENLGIIKETDPAT